MLKSAFSARFKYVASLDFYRDPKTYVQVQVWPRFNPYPWIFGTVTESSFWKKSKNIACHSWESQLGTEKIKVYFQKECQWAMLRCQFKMSYANIKVDNILDMSLSAKIHAIFGIEKSSIETYTNWCKAALWIFFPENALSDRSAFWFVFFFSVHG